MGARQHPFYREFGEKLAAARRAAKTTQQALSKAVGLSRTSIVNIEKGRHPVQLHLAVKLAGSLGVEMSTLLPKSHSVAPAFEVNLEKVSKQNKPWVERIMARIKVESDDAAEVFASEAKSPRVTPTGKGKKTARSR